MDNYFIVNPISGGGSAARVLPQIEALAASLKNCHLHTTSEKGSAKTFVHKIAESGRPCRFYAVGGDGTLNEIVNGIYSFSNAEAGFVPCGTGNDFSRCFSPDNPITTDIATFKFDISFNDIMPFIDS